MIFKSELVDLIKQGKKTMTRRPVKANQDCRYREGHVYALQPGRGARSEGKLSIIAPPRVERLGDISIKDARREGFVNVTAFMEYWRELYGAVDRDQKVWVIAFVYGDTRVLHRELRQVLLELELVSQVPAASLGSSSRDSTESIGGKRPPGGVQWHDEGFSEEVEEFPQRGAEHFKYRIARVARNAQRRLSDGMEQDLVERSSTAALAQILKDAKAALRAAKRQPPAVDPSFGSPQWKRHVAESKDSLGTLATRFGCSRAYIQEIRRRYRVDEVA